MLLYIDSCVLLKFVGAVAMFEYGVVIVWIGIGLLVVCWESFVVAFLLSFYFSFDVIKLFI